MLPNASIIKAIRAEARQARKTLKAAGYGFATLTAAPNANPKLEKSQSGLKVSTIPLHLAPADLSGFNVCPMASAGCKAACLHTAGNPVYFQGKHKARIARTRAYFSHRADFMAVLVDEIRAHIVKCQRQGYKPAVRLNATSDIPWERVPVSIGGQSFPNVMAVFPSITFYDYTKRPNRRGLPANYTLTFSLAENNDAAAAQALANGHNVAAVFNVKRNGTLPQWFALAGQNVPVIDGDEHDFRPIDPQGVIVGLRAKGDAIGDRSGFVREPDHRFNA